MRWMLSILGLSVTIFLAGAVFAQDSEQTGKQDTPPAEEVSGKGGSEEEARRDDERDEEGEERRELSEEDLLVLLEEKLEMEFVKAIPWQRDLEAAVEISTTDKKPILVYCTRSDTECPPCYELEERFLGSDSFVSASEGFVPLLKIWSGVDEACSGEGESDVSDEGSEEIVVVDEDEADESTHKGSVIAAGHWPESFPFVAVLDHNGGHLFDLDAHEAGDNFTEFVSLAAKDAQALSEARTKLEKKKRHKKSRATVAMIEALRGIEEREMEQLEKAAKSLEEDEELMARFARYRVVRPIERAKEHYESEVQASFKLTKTEPEKSRERIEKARVGVQKAMYDQYKSGDTLTDTEEPLYDYFWRNAMYASIDANDKRGAAISYNALSKVADKIPTVKMMLLGIRKRIEAM